MSTKPVEIPDEYMGLKRDLPAQLQALCPHGGKEDCECILCLAAFDIQILRERREKDRELIAAVQNAAAHLALLVDVRDPPLHRPMCKLVPYA